MTAVSDVVPSPEHRGNPWAELDAARRVADRALEDVGKVEARQRVNEERLSKLRDDHDQLERDVFGNVNRPGDIGAFGELKAAVDKLKGAALILACSILASGAVNVFLIKH